MRFSTSIVAVAVLFLTSNALAMPAAAEGSLEARDYQDFEIRSLDEAHDILAREEAVVLKARAKTCKKKKRSLEARVPVGDCSSGCPERTSARVCGTTGGMGFMYRNQCRTAAWAAMQPSVPAIYGDCYF